MRKLVKSYCQKKGKKLNLQPKVGDWMHDKIKAMPSIFSQYDGAVDDSIKSEYGQNLFAIALDFTSQIALQDSPPYTSTPTDCWCLLKICFHKSLTGKLCPSPCLARLYGRRYYEC